MFPLCPLKGMHMFMRTCPCISQRPRRPGTMGTMWSTSLQLLPLMEVITSVRRRGDRVDHRVLEVGR